MASRQWLKDNPKVLAYVPRPVYQRLKVFIKERKVSVSKAVTLILEAYFELEPEQPLASDEVQRDAKLDKLEQELKELTAQVAELHQQLGRERSDTARPTQRSEATQSNTPTQEGIRKLYVAKENLKLRRETTDFSEPKLSSDQVNSRSKNEMFGASSQTPQDSTPDEEENIPISQTTPMKKQKSKGGDDQANQSLNQDSSSKNRAQGMLGRLGFRFDKKSNALNQDSSSTTQRALPPSDP